MSAVSPMSANEMMESLTGYEEEGLAKAFGVTDWTELGSTKPVMLVRALAFVHFKREGMDHAKARDAAYNLTIKQANEFFADEADEIFEDEPVTEQGKGDAPAE